MRAKSRLRSVLPRKEAAPKGGPSQGGYAQGGLQHRYAMPDAAMHNHARAKRSYAHVTAMQRSGTGRAHEVDFQYEQESCPSLQRGAALTRVPLRESDEGDG